MSTPTPPRETHTAERPAQTLTFAAVAWPKALWRRFLISSLVLWGVEIGVVVAPLVYLFELKLLSPGAFMELAAPAGILGASLWLATLLHWTLPIRRAQRELAGSTRASREATGVAFRAVLKVPLQALVVRTVMWAGIGAAFGMLGYLRSLWGATRVLELTALATLHGYIAACVRVLWWERLLSKLRHDLFVGGSPLRRFDSAHFRALLLVGAVVSGGVLVVQASFSYYFLPLTQTQYLQLQSLVPVAQLLGFLLWVGFARHTTGDLRAYLASTRGEGSAPMPPAGVFQRVQGLPYRLALGKWVLGTLIAVAIAWWARQHLGFAVDDAVIVGALVALLALAGSIYEALWHRDVLRPLLAHLTSRYRVALGGITPLMSLRAKLQIAFGGIVMLACGMALLWGVVQYKRQATEAVAQQADLGLAWMRSELQAELGTAVAAPTPQAVRDALARVISSSPSSSAAVYYLDDTARIPAVMAIGGETLGPPQLPWYIRARLQRPSPGVIVLPKAGLTGRAARLALQWHGARHDVGALAVFYPSYRHRGGSMLTRPIWELVMFFLLLFVGCGGIVGITVHQFVSPIRRLEHRAQRMAAGELADPVTVGGENDEIGRLTLAMEQMRRALREKLRSTEEVNIDLERAVQMRTSDLARKNRELAAALDQLTKAQAQLVRSEKLASIGQLVAGIAHEINNPVNAIVNTVGPMQEAIMELAAADPKARQAAADDIRDMARVVQSGAQRTKAIVTALHNYSRTDDDRLVDFDIDRTIADSLELLRHELRNHIKVHTTGVGGQVRGHAGQIGQVLLNLLTNAAQAMVGRPDARLEVHTEGDATKVMIRIVDNGPGIPPEVLPRIWDPFFTTKDVGQGTGLGLSIVHELVERHNGTIEVSTDVGVGTTFTVTLPRHPPV